ncbi:MAG: alanine racemase [Rhodobacteraceae bacterium]|nr:alanine racemase [Paracoccaceae bacterium]
MIESTLHINVTAVQENWRALHAMSGSDVETGAVVKADGYGLGAARISLILRQAGVRSFFVAQMGEGVELRSALGDDCTIYILTGHLPGGAPNLKRSALTPILNSAEQFARHMSQCPDLPFALQLDTGMNRLGMEPREFASIRESAMRAGPVLVMSHLACAEEPGHGMNATQLNEFRLLTEGLQVRRSLSATGGILLGEGYHFDLTRPGIGMFGGLPFAAARPVISLDIPVIQHRIVKPGEAVGYGADWVADSTRNIATISAGYADGIFRHLGPGAVFYSGDRPCPVVGRISMDLITVDISDLEKTPESLQLLGPNCSVDQFAEAAGTIGHEVLTVLGSRYRKNYFKSD